MLAIKDYWLLPPAKQQKRLNAINKIQQQADLEREACEKQLIIYKGKLVTAEDYPCTCELACPSQCYEEREGLDKKWSRQEIKAEQCFCPCHTWYEPF